MNAETAASNAAASHAAAEPWGAPDRRPVLFLHIAKTAGTAFLQTLNNLFGDRHVSRVHMESDESLELIDTIGAAPPEHLACVGGHPPRHHWNAHIGRFRPFTLLRAPIPRVQSLFRYIRNESDTTLTAWGLSRGFSFDEFIASTNCGVVEHASNGMCRMLCGDPRFTTPGGYGTADFNDPAHHGAILDGAIRLLEEIDFGIVEDMEATLRLVQMRWGIPFPIDNVVANTTERLGVEDEPDSIRRIAEMNTLDLALYERASLLFRKRMARLEALAVPENTMAVFAPEAGEPVPISKIPGRQGFHGAEAGGIAWLDHAVRPRIHFRPPCVRGYITLRFYRPREFYPADRIAVHLDGTPMPMRLATAEGKWCTLVSDPVPLASALHELAIDPPYWVPERVLNPNAPRARRSLSVALATISITPTE